jgi:UDP-N-acetylmuramoyl-tripeptide--D-alanyl-D-alanine ligase
MTFGLGQHNDEFPSEMNFVEDSVSFNTHQGGARKYTLPLLGEHNVINSLAALIVARHYKVPEEKIVQGLQTLALTGMRIEFIACENGITILNDAYNASPTSMKAALHVLENMKGYQRKIAVLGDMLELGASEGKYHEEIGNLLDASKLDYLLTLGELGKRIAEGAKKRLDEKKIYAYTDKAELIAKLETMLSPQDVVLVKASRGMALEKVVEQIKQFKHQ